MAPAVGWKLALVSSLFSTIAVVMVIRVGLLATVIASFVGLVLTFAAVTLDLSSWYGGLALLPLGVLLAISAYGTVTALAGKSILGDPLGEVERG